MRIRWTIGVILAVILSTGTVAQAEVYQDVIRGFELFGWRFSGQQNLLGKGWDVSAVADYSAGANFNLGIADVTFSGTAIGATAGYTLRGIPSAHFRMGTNNTPLAYTYAFNTGLQDMTIEGGILINIDTEINLLGFYDNTIRISNR